MKWQRRKRSAVLHAVLSYHQVANELEFWCGQGGPVDDMTTAPTPKVRECEQCKAYIRNSQHYGGYSS